MEVLTFDRLLTQFRQLFVYVLLLYVKFLVQCDYVFRKRYANIPLSKIESLEKISGNRRGKKLQLLFDLKQSLATLFRLTTVNRKNCIVFLFYQDCTHCRSLRSLGHVLQITPLDLFGRLGVFNVVFLLKM